MASNSSTYLIEGDAQEDLPMLRTPVAGSVTLAVEFYAKAVGLMPGCLRHDRSNGSGLRQQGSGKLAPIQADTADTDIWFLPILLPNRASNFPPYQHGSPWKHYKYGFTRK
ncbi:hypothetical protein BU17DRAFT_104116 [Hysterangium stoloniferum]|nr:hypothetical protein BU17DRAFT_104116 [Hysterangium stoloniferum]